MRHAARVLVVAALVAALSPTTALPASGEVQGAPSARLAGPVHTDWLRLKVACFAGDTATVVFGLVTQPSDPDFGDPTGTPDPTNAARFAQDITVRCTGKAQSVKVPLVPAPCGAEGCIPRLEKGVRADVFWLMDFRSSGDEQDFVRLDVRVV